MNAVPQVDRELVDVGSLDRKSYLGGGDIAALLGADPYRTPLDVFYAKTADLRPRVEPIDSKAARRKQRGKKLEPYVLEMLQEEHAIEVVARNHRYRDPLYAFMRPARFG